MPLCVDGFDAVGLDEETSCHLKVLGFVVEGPWRPGGWQHGLERERQDIVGSAVSRGRITSEDSLHCMKNPVGAQFR